MLNIPASRGRLRCLFKISLLVAVALHAPTAAGEVFQAFPVANLNRTFDPSALRAVEDPVAVAHGLVFTWSRELWRTDGTPLGTRRLCGPDLDLCVHVRRGLASSSGLLYFLDDRLQDEDMALWRTDGTVAGTFPVTSPHSTRLEEGTFVNSHLHEPSGRLFFEAENRQAATGLEPWVTDGTPEGTRQVRDLARGPWVEGSFPLYRATLGPGVVFTAGDGQAIRSLWFSDGTAEGTFELLDLAGESDFPYGFTTLGEQLVFFLRAGSGNGSLWRTDGRRDGITERVARFSSVPANVVGPVLGDRALFLLGVELWATDGTAQGTGPLADVGKPGDLVQESIPVGERAIFRVVSPTEGERLWATDGTAQGTRLLIDPCPGRCNSHPRGFHPVGNRVVFAMNDGLAGHELWITDGTPGDTRRLADLCPGPCNGRPEVIGDLGGFLWVRADGGEGRELWRVRIATGDAEPLTDLDPADPFPGAPDGAFLEGALIFSAADHEHGRALWRSDGTTAGTSPYLTLADPADQGSSPTSFLRRGHEIFFGARMPRPGLWATDGVETRLVWPAPDGVESVERIVRFGGSRGPLLFTTEEGDGRIDLYRSDGTAEGTVRLADGIDRFSASPLIDAGDRIFYLAEGFPRPWEEAGVWVSDGTVEGTRRVLRLPVLDFPETRFLGSTLFFVVSNAGTSLWVSDGSPEGTRPLLDHRGRPVRQPRLLTVLGSSLFFSAVNPDEPVFPILWTSDGSPEGTRPVLDPRQRLIRLPDHLTLLGSSLFFSAANPDETERETILWVSDGNPGGTRPVIDSGSGPPLFPVHLTVVGSTLFFLARETTAPFFRLLWRSDGTAGGTRPLEAPAGLLAANRLQALGGNRLLFFARTVQPGNAEESAEALWITDGTFGGTRRLAPVSREITAVAAGESLFFLEDDLMGFSPNFPQPEAPPILWHSDGTAEGTAPLTLPLPEALPKRLESVAGHVLLVTLNEERGEDLWVLGPSGATVARIGRFTSVGEGFLRLGRRVLFTATDRQTGTELWAFELPAGALEARRLRKP